MHITTASLASKHTRYGIQIKSGTPVRAKHATLAASPEPLTLTSKGGQPLKVSMVSLGCPKNTVDGEVLLGDLFRSGFEITDAHEDSDAIIINTCAFVEDAKTESLDTIMEAARLKQDGKVKKLIVTGCLAQRYSDQLAEQLPEADLIVGFEKYSTLSSSMKQVLGDPQMLTFMHTACDPEYKSEKLPLDLDQSGPT